MNEQMIRSVRRISSELRPSVLDDFGPVGAIEWQAQEFETRTGLRCRCDCNVRGVELAPDQTTAIFRIVQESLTNILRHARAAVVDIAIRVVGGDLVLTVQDNGRGITPNEISNTRSLGLLGMQERARLAGGSMRINGVAGEGTRVELTVPMGRVGRSSTADRASSR